MVDLETKLLDIHFDDGYLDASSKSGTFARYSYPSIEIHIDIPFDDDPQQNEGSITMYNLSSSSLNKIKKGINVGIFAGTTKDWGALMAAKITKVETRFDGPTKATTLSIVDYGDFQRTPANITFANGTRGETILRRLCELVGTSPAVIELGENKIYESGYKVSGSIGDAFTDIIADCKTSMYWRRGLIYIRDIKKGEDERFILNSSTGLIGSPERVETDDYKGYNVQCILQHRISTASIIQLDSKHIKGTFRVKSGRHSFDGSSFVTEMLVIE